MNYKFYFMNYNSYFNAVKNYVRFENSIRMFCLACTNFNVLFMILPHCLYNINYIILLHELYKVDCLLNNSKFFC